jgi:hypothetical protein
MVTCSEITNITRIATRDGTQLEFRTLLDPDYARLVRTLRSSRGSSEEHVRLERTRERERELAIEILFEELRSLLMEITDALRKHANKFKEQVSKQQQVLILW